MKLLTTKKDFSKGQTIWLIPIGNNVKRGNISLNEQIIEGVVEKVGGKNITLNDGISFNMFGEYDRHNSGYLPFVSKEKAEEYLEMQKFISMLKYSSAFGNWNQEQIKEMKDIFDKYEKK